MQANTFSLSGGLNLQITYSAQEDAGQPVLTYKAPGADKAFRGADIRIVNTELGQLITVTLQMGLDQGTKLLTLLLPTVAVLTADKPVPIKAEAIFTTFPKPISASGTQQTYLVEPLHGSAEFRFVQTGTPAGA